MKINEKNLCVFATIPPYDCEGFLNKRGEVNKAFQKRYFVLKGNLLFYFEKKGDKEPLGLIIVEGCTIELSEESDQYCFEIAFNGNRTYILSADSQESMETWMKALTCAGYEYRKLMVAELQRQLEEIEGSRNKILNETLSTNPLMPKPPPRRQNPFNRPAPAPPLSKTNDDAFTNTKSPFQNGALSYTAENSFSKAHAGKPVSTVGERFDSKISHRGISSLSTICSVPESSSATLPYALQSGTATKSEFYLPLQAKDDSSKSMYPERQNGTINFQLPTGHTVFPKTESFGAHHENKNISYCSKYFNQLHEQFQNLIMKDVKAYQLQRELKTRPLIEL